MNIVAIIKINDRQFIVKDQQILLVNHLKESVQQPIARLLFVFNSQDNTILSVDEFDVTVTFVKRTIKTSCNRIYRARRNDKNSTKGSGLLFSKLQINLTKKI